MRNETKLIIGSESGPVANEGDKKAHMLKYNGGVELLTCYNPLQPSFIQRLDAIADNLGKESKAEECLASEEWEIM